MKKSFKVMEDFDMKTARISINGDIAVIDNVKRAIIMSDTNITVDYGRGQLSLYGTDLTVEYIYDERMRVKGRFSGVELFGGSSVK